MADDEPPPKPGPDVMRGQIADYKAALDLQAKWFCEWQARRARVECGQWIKPEAA